MVLINGQKFACDSCIRGHRSSSCAHTSGRTLHLVRAKGRPASQCEKCRAKRKEKGVHAKCVCAGPSASKSPVEDAQTRRPFAKTEQWKPSMEPATPVGEKHSLEALMNPCRCRTTGICICCKSNDGALGEEVDEDGASSSLCAGTSDCCSGDGAGGGKCCGSTATSSTRATSPSVRGACCPGGGRRKASKRPSPSSTSRTVDGQDYIDSVLASAGIQPLPLSEECQCGPGCRCDGCLTHAQKQSRTSQTPPAERSPSAQHGADCPTRCDTCISCDLGLLLPSGLEEVDRFMKDEGGAAARKGNEPKAPLRRPRSVVDEHEADDDDSRLYSTVKRQRRSESIGSARPEVASLEKSHAADASDSTTTRALFSPPTTDRARMGGPPGVGFAPRALGRPLIAEHAGLGPSDSVQPWQHRRDGEHSMPGELQVSNPSRRFTEGR